MIALAIKAAFLAASLVGTLLLMASGVGAGAGGRKV